jgi:hypothetical protein
LALPTLISLLLYPTSRASARPISLDDPVGGCYNP